MEGEDQMSACTEACLCIAPIQVLPPLPLTTKQTQEPDGQSTFHLGSGQIKRRIKAVPQHFLQHSWWLMQVPASLAVPSCPALPLPCAGHVMSWSGAIIWIRSNFFSSTSPFLKTVFSLNQQSLLKMTLLMKEMLANSPPPLGPCCTVAPWTSSSLRAAAPVPPQVMHIFNWMRRESVLD